MKMVKTYNLLFHVLIFVLFLLNVKPSISLNDKTPSSKFVKQFLGSKRGDTVEGLEQVREYLSKYGYLDPSTDGRPYYQRASLINTFNNVFDEALKNGIEKFQLFYNINVSGMLDEKTLSIMARPRCSFPDLINNKTPRNTIYSSYYSFLGPKWSKFNLTWYSASSTRLIALSPLRYAFETWAEASKFSFRKASSFSNSDVKIHFGSSYQGNVHPFTNTEYAFTDPLPRAMVYFNVDANWSVGMSERNYDIESVAVHEIGHILGLDHSSVEDAVMYSTLHTGVTKRELHDDDIEGINVLYP